MPETIVSAAVPVTAAPMRVRMREAVSNASLTRMTEMLLKRSVTSRYTASSLSGATAAIARWVWGNDSSVPGAKTTL